MDAAPPQSAELTSDALPSSNTQPGLEIDEFWRDADADSVGLTTQELAAVLGGIGVKFNYGLPPGVQPTRTQIGAFWRTLQLKDLALAHACALGRSAAWQQFMARFRKPLTQAAIGITGSVALGEELADSLYAEMFGVTERGVRRSPLAYYTGRGSLKGFLRATLAQRNVDRHRRTGRETPIDGKELPATPMPAQPDPKVLSLLRASLRDTLSALSPEERFLLSASFLDGRAMLEISRILRVHEATVSRRVHRLTTKLHKELLRNLQSSGMSRAAAQEALGTDPRDVEINLRSMLQASQTGAFSEQEAAVGNKRR